MLGGLRNPPASTDYVGIVPIIEEQMSPRLWDLVMTRPKKPESIDFFEPREELAGVVVRGLGSVENASRGGSPSQSGKDRSM